MPPPGESSIDLNIQETFIGTPEVFAATKTVEKLVSLPDIGCCDICVDHDGAPLTKNWIYVSCDPIV